MNPSARSGAARLQCSNCESRPGQSIYLAPVVTTKTDYGHSAARIAAEVKLPSSHGEISIAEALNCTFPDFKLAKSNCCCSRVSSSCFASPYLRTYDL